MSLLYWVAQNWTRHSRYGIVSPNWKLRDCLSQPAGDAVPLGCPWLPLPESMLLAPVHVFHRGLYCKTTSQLASPHPILVHGVVPSEMQNAVFSLVQLHEVCVSHFLQPAKVPLHGCMTLWCIDHSPVLQCSGSSVEMLNRTGASIHSWVTLLVAGLQEDFVLLIITAL